MFVLYMGMQSMTGSGTKREDVSDAEGCEGCFLECMDGPKVQMGKNGRWGNPQGIRLLWSG
jgi:hypothetical protein